MFEAPLQQTACLVGQLGLVRPSCNAAQLCLPVSITGQIQAKSTSHVPATRSPERRSIAPRQLNRQLPATLPPFQCPVPFLSKGETPLIQWAGDGRRNPRINPGWPDFALRRPNPRPRPRSKREREGGNEDGDRNTPRTGVRRTRDSPARNRNSPPNPLGVNNHKDEPKDKDARLPVLPASTVHARTARPPSPPSKSLAPDVTMVPPAPS